MLMSLLHIHGMVLQALLQLGVALLADLGLNTGFSPGRMYYEGRNGPFLMEAMPHTINQNA